ncbi:MAG TPA: hypothetical protein VFI84_04040 [Candidatus Saccharimonadales bacterium]|nr:hypothetical protein [Candidatus Saccharimonadales bacterium]
MTKAKAKTQPKQAPVIKVGGAKPSPVLHVNWLRGKRQQLILSLVVVVIVVAIGGYWHQNANNKQAEKKLKETPALINEADSRSNYSEAVQLIQAEIAHTDKADKVRLAQLYSNLAGEYINETKYSDSITSYNKAVTENGITSDIAKQMAYAYMAMNNNAQAIVYLKKAVELWPKDSPLYTAETRALQQTIDELQKKGQQ